MASHEHHRRRNSIEEPPDMLSDVIDLKEELNTLHEKTSPECQQHLKKMNNLVNEFEEDYRVAVRASTGGAIAARAGGVGGSVMLMKLALSAATATSTVVAIGVAAIVAVAIVLVIGAFKKKQQEKNTRKRFEDELTELQKKISPLIDVLNKFFVRVHEILRDPKISEQKANEIRDYLSKCFEKMRLFQTDDNRLERSAVPERLRLTADISKTFADMSRLLELLEEILGDDGEQMNRPNERPDDTTTEEQMEKTLKEKTEKFIDEMRKGINQLENTMNEIDQIKKRLGNTI